MRKHADTQARLCRRFATPVIATVTCQDITAGHMQQIVNSAPTAGEGDRLRRCLSAMVSAGITGGYLTNPRPARAWAAVRFAIPKAADHVARESPIRDRIREPRR